MFSVLSNLQLSRKLGSVWKYNRLPNVNYYLRVSAVNGSQCWPPSNPCCLPCPPGDGGGSRHQIVYKPYTPHCYKDHDHKNMTLRRPMSPHLTIYAPTFTAMTSIAQRITGVALVFYALLLSGGTLFLSNGIETYVSIIQSLDLSSATITIIKLFIGTPFTFHYFNGMRYASWNAGKNLKLKEVYATGKVAIAAASVLNILFAFLL